MVVAISIPQRVGLTHGFVARCDALAGDDLRMVCDRPTGT